MNKHIVAFIEVLQKSHLVDDHHIRQALKKNVGDFNQSDAPEAFFAFRDGLVEEGLLTPWQCERLSLGKSKGFFFDHFVLLERLDDGASDVRIYSACNRRTGEIQKLRVFIPFPNEAGFRYEIDQSDAFED